MPIRCTSSFLISCLALYMGFTVPKISSQQVVINEVVSSNQRGLLDPSGGTPDWIELFNPGPGVASLADYALTDDPANPRKWILSSGTIPPGGFLLVFADGKDRQPSRFPARDPGTTPGLVSWIKASSVSTNDTTAVRRSGVLYFLKRWPDLSGAGNHWTQDSTSLQPYWLPPTNGLPAAFRFDGGNDTLLTSRSLASNNFCIIAVCRTRVPHEIDPQSPSGTAGTSGQRYFLGANHLGALDSGMGVSLGTNGAAIYEHGDNYMPPVASVSGNMAGYQLLAWHYSNGTPRIYWQGALSAEGLPSSRRHVAAPTSLGSGPYGAWSGDLAEMMIFNRALTPEELGGIQTHLLSEYQMPSREAWHANFSISSSGETLQWVSPQGIVADSATIPAILPSDVSLGRSPDGTGLLDRYFASPTPGASNSTPPSRELLESVTFSHAAGYHTNTFLLTLSCATPGTTIRYTVDGSEPTQTSLLYQGPFAVTNRSRSPNNLSLIPTFPGGVIPSGVVYKFTVVRTKAFKPEGLPGRTSTRTFIVEPRGSSRFSLPVVSLISPRENFFDNNIGIYVPGNAPGGNYSQSGDAWERPGHVEFFEPDGTLGFSQGTGIRMHGNTSFQFPVKGLRLHALNHPGTGPFRHRIFPDHPVETFNRLLLRPSGHDYNLTMFRDVFMQSLGRELGLETQISRAALLFINGEYWGIHHCQEAFEPGYFAA
ncbi:MAG: hypothetical protein FJ405_17680, partial [Verrucomicrobia bacterium]|nr:hypothetical protein [Verrucomicrobiota bacterium]